jgi:cytochrome c oxidase cbb3-type subunit 4
MMDMNDVRAWYTLLLMIVLIGIAIWAYSKNRQRDFHEAAHLPLNEPESPAKPNPQQGGER